MREQQTKASTRDILPGSMHAAVHVPCRAPNADVIRHAKSLTVQTEQQQHSTQPATCVAQAPEAACHWQVPYKLLLAHTHYSACHISTCTNRVISGTTAAAWLKT
jgi:hypothetical protein